MILGSCAIGLCAGGGFCAGSEIVVDHQRINGPSFVFSASMPPLLAVSASEGINILRSTPSIFEALQENVRAARSILDKVDCITIPSHPASPVIHIYVKHAPVQQPGSAGLLTPASAALISPTKHTKELLAQEYAAEERALQEIVEECLSQNVMVTRAKTVKGQELVEAKPSIKLALTAALTRKETEKAVSVVKAACVKVLGRRR